MIERTHLKPDCRVLINFIKIRFMPIAHNTMVLKEIMLLLHSIMKGRKINIGDIIFDEVHECAQKNIGSLIFPSLI